MSQENLRAADTDRNRVVEELREHTAAGRLTLDEFGERMQAAMSARTFGDLAKLTTDLPVLATAPAQDGPVDLAAFRPPPVKHNWARAVRVWASVSVFLIGIWMLSVVASGGHTHGFWPIWPIGIGGLVLLSRIIRNGGYGRPSLADRHDRHLEMRDARRERLESRMDERSARWEERVARRAERWGRHWDDRR
jgi:hypothetical protein